MYIATTTKTSTSSGSTGTITAIFTTTSAFPSNGMIKLEIERPYYSFASNLASGYIDNTASGLTTCTSTSCTGAVTVYVVRIFPSSH